MKTSFRSSTKNLSSVVIVQRRSCSSTQSTIDSRRSSRYSTQRATFSVSKKKNIYTSEHPLMLDVYLKDKSRLEKMFVDMALAHGNKHHAQRKGIIPWAISRKPSAEPRKKEVERSLRHRLETAELHQHFRSCGGSMTDQAGHSIDSKCCCLQESWVFGA